MTARDDYPKLGEWSAIDDRSLTHEQLVAALDELDRLRALRDRLCQSDWIVCAEALRIIDMDTE